MPPPAQNTYYLPAIKHAENTCPYVPECVRTRASDHTIRDRDYDALGRLIVSKTHQDGAFTKTDKFDYNAKRQQIIEVRDGSDNVERHVVYGSQYIDELSSCVGRGVNTRQTPAGTYSTDIEALHTSYNSRR